MDVKDLAFAALYHDDLGVRQWVKSALRCKFDFSQVRLPQLLDSELCVAACLVELLAQRCNQDAPAWVHTVGPSDHPIYLMPSAKSIDRWRDGTPECLEKRNVFACPDYLNFTLQGADEGRARP